MKKMIYISLFTVVIIILIAYFVFKPKRKIEQGSDYFFATEGQGNERLSSLGLEKRTEDVSHILDTGRLDIPRSSDQPKREEYKADPEQEWIITLTTAIGQHFETQELLKVFDYDWRSQFASEFYGLSVSDRKWTFAFSGDSSDKFEKVQLAINLTRLFEEDASIDPKKLERYIPELEKRIRKFPVKINYSLDESIDRGVEKAKKLQALTSTFSREAVIVLQGAKPFNGLEVWHVLQSAGLEWGDGDLFHWNNGANYGDDQLFSVLTTTQPGYFLPEEIKEGQMNPENLVFSFSVPRSGDPVNVFNVMIDAVRFAQNRLGGKILTVDGEAFNEEKEMQELEQFVKRMRAAGIEPGSDRALRMFW